MLKLPENTDKMNLTPRKINLFNLVKLPMAYFGGVRVKSVSEREVKVVIKHKWKNQNPFKSMFWAAQGMAAEMSTGALVMNAIENSGKKISMLVIHQNATFTKKATGKITFTCNQGEEVTEVISQAIETGEGQTILMNSIGVNEDGIMVSKFQFEWSFKLKK